MLCRHLAEPNSDCSLEYFCNYFIILKRWKNKAFKVTVVRTLSKSHNQCDILLKVGAKILKSVPFLVQVDVSSLENSTGGPELTVAALPRTGEIVLLEMSQRFHLDHLEKVMDVAMKGCKDIHNILDLVVQKHVRKSASFGPEN